MNVALGDTLQHSPPEHSLAPSPLLTQSKKVGTLPPPSSVPPSRRVTVSPLVAADPAPAPTLSLLAVEAVAANYRHSSPSISTAVESPPASLLSVGGASGLNNQLLLVQGELDGIPLTLLIDSGATHNFISSKLLQAHQDEWSVSPSQLSSVRMGDGKAVAATKQQVTARRLQLFGFVESPGEAGALYLQKKTVSFAPVVFHTVSQLTPYCDAVLGLEFFSQAHLNFKYESGLSLVGDTTRHEETASLRSTGAPVRPIVGVEVLQGKDMVSLLLRQLDTDQLVALSEQSALAVIDWDKERVQLVSSGQQEVLAKEAAKVTELLMKEFKEVFADPTAGTPPPVRDVEMSEHKIQLDPAVPPPRPRPFIRLSAEKEAELHKQIDEMVKQGWIRPSQSRFASATFLVPKADGGWRMVVDYRALNNATIKDSYPLPHANDLFDKMRKATVFSKIDLKSGFYQIPLAKEDWYKTAFRTSRGLFEYTVVPMGLCNAPATFMRLMNNIFNDMIVAGFVTVFMDDIVIYSESIQDHWVHLRKVLVRLKEQRLFAKASKCSFFSRAVQFLGHILTPEGVKPMTEKLQAIEAWPVPKDKNELRSFLGLCNYYNKFIANYSTIAAPLTSLTGDTTTWCWSKLEEAAFGQLKAALNSAPCLVHPDPNLQFVLATDASDFALGAVLMQDHGRGLQPIQFYNRKLNAAERNYSTYDKEMLAVVCALNNWYYHLESSSHPIKVMTDHQPLAYSHSAPLKHDKRSQSRWVRWLTELGSFKLQWQHVKGETQMADPLSRRPDLKQLDTGDPSESDFPQTPDGWLQHQEATIQAMVALLPLSAVHTTHPKVAPPRGELHVPRPAWTKNGQYLCTISARGYCELCGQLRNEWRLASRNYSVPRTEPQVESVVTALQGHLTLLQEWSEQAAGVMRPTKPQGGSGDEGVAAALTSVRSELLRDEGREQRRQVTLQRYSHNHEGPVPGAPSADSQGNIIMPTRRCAALLTKQRRPRGERGQPAPPMEPQQCRQLTRVGAYCWSHLAREERLRIKASQIPGAGKGLFALAPIRRGERVCWYTGDVTRVDHDNEQHVGGTYYLQLSRHVGIDAARTDTAPGRYLNDPSGSGKRPNCKFAVDRRLNLACIRATRNIAVGDELLVSYGRGYWKAIRKAGPQATVMMAGEVGGGSDGLDKPVVRLGAAREDVMRRLEACLFALVLDDQASQGTDPPSEWDADEPVAPQAVTLHNGPPTAPTAEPHNQASTGGVGWLKHLSVQQLVEMVKDAAEQDHLYQVMLLAVPQVPMAADGDQGAALGDDPSQSHMAEEVARMVRRLRRPGARTYQVREGLLQVRSRTHWLLVVPRANALRTMVLAYLHDADGHHGRDKVAAAASTRFWWQGMDAAVRKYVASCPKCQQVKPAPGKEQGLAMPLPVPEGPWTWVTMDFLGPLPVTPRGHDMVLVFVDRFTKMKHFAPCKSTITAPQAVELFEQHVVRLHGWPNMITSDRGSIFVSKFWESYFARFGVQLRRSTSHRPQTDGQSEIEIKTLQKVLESYAAATRDDWDTHLPMAEFSINSTPSATTGKSPFKNQYGHEATKPIDLALAKLGLTSTTTGAAGVVVSKDGERDDQGRSDLVEQHLKQLQEVVTFARRRLQDTQERQAAAIANHRRPATYVEGQQVMLSTQHLVLPTDQALHSAKLRPKFVGPYTIVKVVNPNAVKLKLNPGDRFHPVVNVARLKPFVPTPYEFETRPQPPQRPPPQVSDDNGQEEWRVETIVGERYNRRRRRQEWCVKWLGYDDSECTWEPLENLFDNEQFLQYLENHPASEVVQRHLVDLQTRQQQREADAVENVGLAAGDDRKGSSAAPMFH
jgi:hypothetical protein